MRLLSMAAAATLAVAGAGAASAATMTFSGLDASIVRMQTYTEDGIIATNTNDDGIFWGYPSGSQLHFDPGGFDNVSYDFTFSGGLFDLKSVDVTCCQSTGALAVLTAFGADGSTIRTGSFDASSNGTLAFDDWTGISRLNITDTTAHFSIDNLTIAGASTGAVPEPATWAMMIAGVGGAGGMLRRRRVEPGRVAARA